MSTNQQTLGLATDLAPASAPLDVNLIRRDFPILQERGLFRTEYTHETLRGHLGLAIPPYRYTAARTPASETRLTAPRERSGSAGAACTNGLPARTP